MLVESYYCICSNFVIQHFNQRTFDWLTKWERDNASCRLFFSPLFLKCWFSKWILIQGLHKALLKFCCSLANPPLTEAQRQRVEALHSDKPRSLAWTRSCVFWCTTTVCSSRLNEVSWVSEEIRNVVVICFTELYLYLHSVFVPISCLCLMENQLVGDHSQSLSEAAGLKGPNYYYFPPISVSECLASF